MIDREKVIEWADKCTSPAHKSEDCNECPYHSSYHEGFYSCIECLMMDAVELLEEQEAVEPILIREGRNKHYNDYVCPRCDNEVVYEQNYCSECGVQFLWKGQ